jgi:hypothetical protein
MNQYLPEKFTRHDRLAFEAVAYAVPHHWANRPTAAAHLLNGSPH